MEALRGENTAIQFIHLGPNNDTAIFCTTASNWKSKFTNKEIVHNVFSDLVCVCTYFVPKETP